MRKKDRANQPATMRASTDGIVSNNRQLGEPLKPSKRRRKKAEGLSSGFKRTDGFHPMRQSPGGLGYVATNSSQKNDEADEPIVIEDKIGRKKGWWVPKSLRWRTVLKHFSLAASAFILVGLIFFVSNFILTSRHILRGGGNAPALAANVDINQLRGEGDGRINILLLGVGGPGHDGADLTDTIMLTSIDPVNHKTVLLSLPRDFWVHIPDDGYNKINAAYAFGKEQAVSGSGVKHIRNGLSLLDRTLSPIIGVPIHYHAIINFKAFKDSVNAVGGVDVNVPEQLYDPTIAWENKYNPIIAKKGPQKFNGQRALLYVKSRETSSDFARAERQRLVLTALKDKVLNLGTFSNPIRMTQLLNSLGANVYSDFSLNDLSRLYQIISQVPSKDIKSLDLVTPPHQLLTTGNINGLSIVRPLAGLFDYSSILKFVRSNLPDGFIVKEHASIAVYNATSTPGLATKEGKVLKGYNYHVTTIANSPNTTNPASSVVVDLSHGVDKYTRHYLENRFHVTAQDKVPDDLGLTPPANTDFVIILGKDVR